MAIQLDMFQKELIENQAAITKLEKIHDEIGQIRRGLFWRFTELKKKTIETESRCEELEKKCIRLEQLLIREVK